MTDYGSTWDRDDLGGGRYRQTVGLKPRNYLRDGTWRAIANHLGASGDPALPVGVDELASFRLRDKLAGNSPVVHFGRGQSMVRFTPLGTANVNGVAYGDNGFEYPGAWANADLRMVMGGHILRKEVVLRTGHPAAFEFRIDSQTGLDPDTLSTPDFRILDPVLENGIDSVPLSWLKRTEGGKLILRAELPAGDWAGWVLDPTLVLQPDAAAGDDAYIFNTSPDANRGGSALLVVGNGLAITSRSLIKFDLSSIPATATVDSATLSLYAITDNSDNARAFRVYRQLRAWVEMQATWNIYSTGNNWQTAGGFGVADCEQTDIGSRNMTATETLNEFKNWTLTPSGVRGWISGTLTNNGMLIKADTEVDDRYDFASSDNATAANRPIFTIEYTEAVVGGDGGLAARMLLGRRRLRRFL